MYNERGICLQPNVAKASLWIHKHKGTWLKVSCTANSHFMRRLLISDAVSQNGKKYSGNTSSNRRGKRRFEKLTLSSQKYSRSSRTLQWSSGPDPHLWNAFRNLSLWSPTSPQIFRTPLGQYYPCLNLGSQPRLPTESQAEFELSVIVLVQKSFP